MKKTRILTGSIILIASIHCYVYGQEQQSKPVKKVCIQDVYVQTGLFTERNSNGTLADFKTLAPKSKLLDNNFTDYNTNSGMSMNSNTMFSVMLGIKFGDTKNKKYKPNPLLRLGISYFSGTSLTGYLYKETRKTYDTLTSSQTGQNIYLDSITSQSYGMNYSSQQLRFDGSVIFRTNPEARWSLYTGIGITAGLSINAKTEIYYSKNQYSNSNSTSYSSFGSGDYKSENFKQKNNFGASTFIPLGVDFRIGKKREFWKRTHLFYELRPSINITSIPELRTTINPSLQHGLGLRVSWN